MNKFERKYILLELDLLSCSEIIDWSTKLLSINFEKKLEIMILELAGLSKKNKYECEEANNRLYEIVIYLNPKFNFYSNEINKVLFRYLKRIAYLLKKEKISVFNFMNTVSSINYKFNSPFWLENIYFFYSFCEENQFLKLDEIPKLKEEINLFLNIKL